MIWEIYILRLNNNSLYTGITKDLNKRLEAHRNGSGSKYVRSHLPFILVYRELAENRSDALKKEIYIKSLSKKQKEMLIKEAVMSFPIEPLFDRVFVKKDETKKTESGLHLPETVKGRAQTGVVVAVGPGLRNHLGEYLPPCVKVGDRVYIAEFHGKIVRYKDQEVFIFNENEIIGKLRDGEE